MRSKILMSASGLAALLLGTAAFADSMPMDAPVTMNGVETVCTGIGDEAQADPRWKAYPARIEFSNGGAQYLSGVHLTLSDEGGKTITTLDCAGAWVLFKLAPGRYKVSASLLSQPGAAAKSVTIEPPATGQKRFVIQFTGVNANQ